MGELAPVEKLVEGDDAQETREYLQELAAAGAIKVQVFRQSPATGPMGSKTKGHLETFDEPISAEEISEKFGGGHYLLKIAKHKKDGKFQYFATRNLHIAGNPKEHQAMASDRAALPLPTNENATVATAALAAMTSAYERSHAVAEAAAANRSAMDPAVQQLISGMQSQLGQLTKQMADKDERILQLITQKPDRTSSDTLLETLLGGESVRIQSLRMGHEAELGSLRNRHDQELDRANQRAEDAIQRQEEAHKRELHGMQMSYEGRIQSMIAAHQSETDGLKRELSNTVDGLKRELAFLGSQFARTETENANLRAKKEKSPIEAIQELALYKEAMESVTGGNEEPQTPSGLAGMVDSVVNSDMGKAIVARVMTPPAPPPPPPAPPRPQFQQLPDGRVVTQKADGTVLEVRAKKKVKTKGGQELPEIDAVSLKTAIDFLENAAQNERPPEEVAKGMSSLVPGAIVAAIREVGVDRFLTEVAKVPASSILRSTQAGRNWIQELADALLK